MEFLNPNRDPKVSTLQELMEILFFYGLFLPVVSLVVLGTVVGAAFLVGWAANRLFGL